MTGLGAGLSGLLPPALSSTGQLCTQGWYRGALTRRHQRSPYKHGCIRLSSPESLAGDHTSSDIARRGQLWVPAAVTETTGRRLPSEASPSGGGGRQKQGESSVSVQLGLVQRRSPVDGLVAEGRAWSESSHPVCSLGLTGGKVAKAGMP
ncbi:hypothetical protein MC885_018335 [Smutsia gigantea]|nr:hypothetical protein MC885_018335 [Smutsia gigantea]